MADCEEICWKAEEKHRALGMGSSIRGGEWGRASQPASARPSGAACTPRVIYERRRAPRKTATSDSKETAGHKSPARSPGARSCRLSPRWREREPYLAGKGRPAPGPSHLAGVELAGDLGQVLAGRGRGLDVVDSGNVNHRRAGIKRPFYAREQKKKREKKTLKKAFLWTGICFVDAFISGDHNSKPFLTQMDGPLREQLR